MTEFFLICIFASAALSLLSYLYCWQDIQRGRPHIISLRQITTIMDRNRLNQMFGSPGPGYYYTLSPPQLLALVRWKQWFFYLECTADTACLLGVWLYMTGNGLQNSVGWFIVLAGLCQGINLAYSIWLIRKWSFQIREEIENSED